MDTLKLITALCDADRCIAAPSRQTLRRIYTISELQRDYSALSEVE